MPCQKAGGPWGEEREREREREREESVDETKAPACLSLWGGKKGAFIRMSFYDT
jgi:hypothetical protein